MNLWCSSKSCATFIHFSDFFIFPSWNCRSPDWVQYFSTTSPMVHPEVKYLPCFSQCSFTYLSKFKLSFSPWHFILRLRLTHWTISSLSQSIWFFPFSKCALQSSVLNVQNGFGHFKTDFFEKFKPTKQSRLCCRIALAPALFTCTFSSFLLESVHFICSGLMFNTSRNF